MVTKPLCAGNCYSGYFSRQAAAAAAAASGGGGGSAAAAAASGGGNYGRHLLAEDEAAVSDSGVCLFERALPAPYLHTCFLVEVLLTC